MKDCQTCPKRAWGEYLHRPGTLWNLGPKSKKSLFFNTEPATQMMICAIWVHILNPSPFFWKFSTFLTKIECFWYLNHFRVTKTCRAWALTDIFIKHPFGMISKYEIPNEMMILTWLWLSCVYQIWADSFWKTKLCSTKSWYLYQDAFLVWNWHLNRKT